MLSRAPEALLDALEQAIRPLESVLVAFSAGVDSTLVLAVATRVLGERATGLVGLSASVAPAEADDARRLAAALGARVEFVPTDELSDPDYVANRPDRCFHCKSGLYATCLRLAAERGIRHVLNGTNADDVGDWRPGLRAADEAGVRSPLLECGLRKADVRAVARRLGLPNWDKPALACLASRLPYGTEVTAVRLQAVDAVERRLRALGFREVRARHFGELVRIEVEPARVAELISLAAGEGGEALQRTVRAAGFARYEIDPEGFRSGRLNDGLRAEPSGPPPEPSSRRGSLHAT